MIDRIDRGIAYALAAASRHDNVTNDVLGCQWKKYTPVTCSSAPCIGRSNAEGDAEALGTTMSLKADARVVS